MSKESTFNFYNKQFDSNYDKYQQYAVLNCNLFFGVSRQMAENFACIIFGCNTASITLSNHIIENLLKQSLIQNDSYKLGEDESVKAYNKYKNNPLRSLITKCFNSGLIEHDENKHLEEIVNNIVRNGFSHSDYDKILGNKNFKIPAFMGNIQSSEMKQVEIDRRHFFSVTEIQMESFAKENAFEYYKYIYDLVLKIENRILTE